MSEAQVFLALGRDAKIVEQLRRRIPELQRVSGDLLGTFNGNSAEQ